MESVISDLRYGLRILIKAPVFTVTAVLMIALGIGANSAIFSVIEAVLMRPLPYDNPDRLVRIYSTIHDSKIEVSSWADIAEWQRQTTTFESVEAFGTEDKVISAGNGPSYVSSGYASAGLYRMLRVLPVLGRGFSPSDYDLNADHIVALGERFWRRQFNSKAATSLKTTDFTVTIRGLRSLAGRWRENCGLMKAQSGKR